MLLAGSVDLGKVLAQLAVARPVFHSEADFQHAFAWLVQSHDPAMRVRLETRPAPGVHLDLDFNRPDLGRSTAVELKYLTRRWSGAVNGERFELKDQGAQDIRAYDCVKDIVRVERFVASRTGCDGAVVVLTNDPSYWKPGADLKETNAAAFRLGEGTVLSGIRSWGPNTGAGTRKGREVDLALAGAHTLGWRDYSTLPSATLRVLLVEVPTEHAASAPSTTNDIEAETEIAPGTSDEAAVRSVVAAARSGSCRDEVLAVAEELSRRGGGLFRVDEVATEMNRRGSRYSESTVRTYVTSVMCANAPVHHANHTDDLVRVSRGVYRLASRPSGWTAST